MDGAELLPPSSRLPPPPVPSARPLERLRDALLESRQRWRDLALLAADFVFETDAEGRLTLLSPDVVLGHTAGNLLGQPAAVLLDGGNPGLFLLNRTARGLKAWAQRADKSRCCLAFNMVPLRDEKGRKIGLRGTARDVTVEEAQVTAAAAALRRTAAFDHLVRRVRGEVTAVGRTRVALEALLPALGCAGAAVLDPERPAGAALLHSAGTWSDDLLHESLARADVEEDRLLSLPKGIPLALLPHGRQNGRATLLSIWRTAGARPWDADDKELMHSISELLRAVLGSETQEQELERQARTDPLTGLLNRRAFNADLAARLSQQLDHGSPPGSLLFADLDHFKPLNDVLGHEAGDAALRQVALLLREGVRPADLVARLGGDEFALWLDGADGQVASARADLIQARTASRLSHAGAPGAPSLSMSIGIAMHRPECDEQPEALLARADAMMYAAKRAGRARWAADDGQALKHDAEGGA